MKKRKKREEKFNLKKEYAENWKYLKKSKNFIYFSILIFLFSALMGFFMTPPDFIIEKIFEFIEEILAQTEGMSSSELIVFIFLNNLQSSFFAMIFGLFFGIFPILSAFFNGYLLGFVSSLAVEESSFLELWRLFPHGLFELPAILISLGLGIKLGISLIYNCILFYNKNFPKIKIYLLILLSVLFLPLSIILVALFTMNNEKLKKKFFIDFKSAFKVFVLIVIPLLIIAAIIEGALISFIT
jgi:stage II sporulation protein M